MGSPNYDLIQAVMGEDAEAVQAALQRGADPDVMNMGTNSALLLAARGGHPEIVSVLLTGGANVNLANSAGDTPLGSASFEFRRAEGDYRRRLSEVIELLESRGAAVSAPVPHHTAAMITDDGRELPPVEWRDRAGEGTQQHGGDPSIATILRGLRGEDFFTVHGALEQLEAMPQFLDEPPTELLGALVELATICAIDSHELGNNRQIAVDFLGRCPRSDAVREALESIVDGADFDIKRFALEELARKFDYRDKLFELISQNQFGISEGALSAARYLSDDDRLAAMVHAIGYDEARPGLPYALKALYLDDGSRVHPPQPLIGFLFEALTDDDWGAFQKADLFEALDKWRELGFIDDAKDRAIQTLRELTRSRDQEVRAQARESLARFTKTAPSSDEPTPAELARVLVATPSMLLDDANPTPAAIEGAAAVLFGIQEAAAFATRRSRYPKCEHELVNRAVNAVAENLSKDGGGRLRQRLKAYKATGPKDAEAAAEVLEALVPSVTETFSEAIYEAAPREITSDEYRQLLVPMLELFKDSFFQAVDCVDGAWGGTTQDDTPKSAPPDGDQLIAELLQLIDSVVWCYRDRNDVFVPTGFSLKPEAEYVDAGYGVSKVYKRVIEIGEQLDEVGGKPLMQKAFYTIAEDGRGWEEPLSKAWHGIGSWLH